MQSLTKGRVCVVSLFLFGMILINLALSDFPVLGTGIGPLARCSPSAHWQKATDGHGKRVRRFVAAFLRLFETRVWKRCHSAILYDYGYRILSNWSFFLFPATSANPGLNCMVFEVAFSFSSRQMSELYVTSLFLVRPALIWSFHRKS